MDIGMLCLITLYGQHYCVDSGYHLIQSIFYPNHGYRMSPRLFFNEAQQVFNPLPTISVSAFTVKHVHYNLTKNVLHVKIFFLT